MEKTRRVSLEGRVPEYLVFVGILVSGMTSVIQVARIGAVGSGYVPWSGAGGGEPEELGHLGLVLVSELAYEVNHLKILGRNHISFRLSRSVPAVPES